MKNFLVSAPVVVMLMTGFVMLSLYFPENHLLRPLTIGIALAGLVVACLIALLYGVLKACGAGDKAVFMPEVAIVLSTACGATIWIMGIITNDSSLGSMSVVSAMCFIVGVFLSEVRLWRIAVVSTTVVAITAVSPLIFLSCDKYWSVVFASVALNFLIAFCALCVNHDNKYRQYTIDLVDTLHDDPP